MFLQNLSSLLQVPPPNFWIFWIFEVLRSVLMWRFLQFTCLNQESIAFRIFQKCHFWAGSFSTSHSSGNQVDGSLLASSTEAASASCSPDGPAPIGKIEVKKFKIFGNLTITLAVRSNQVLDCIVLFLFSNSIKSRNTENVKLNEGLTFQKLSFFFDFCSTSRWGEGWRFTAFPTRDS